jgi:ubiquinone/menaquinone biosynthesis C-methylase UbiE
MKQFDPSVYDFDNPSALFRFEDWLKGLIGGRLFYDPYFETRGGFRGNEKVLDFGCGGGNSTRCIAAKLTQGGRVTGIDISSYFTAKAQKRLEGYSNAEVLRGEITTLSLPERSFDLISIIHVIHDIVKQRRGETVRALAGVLKPGGRLWILEPTRQGHGIPGEEIRRMMAQAGLLEVSAETEGSSFKGIFEKEK